MNVLEHYNPEKLKINDLTALHVASKWYHILRYIKSSSQQVQRFNLASFIDSDLHDIIVDNHNLFLVHDDEPELEYYAFPSLALDSALIALFRAVSDLQSFKSCEKQLRTVDMFMDERKDSTTCKIVLDCLVEKLNTYVWPTVLAEDRLFCLLHHKERWVAHDQIVLPKIVQEVHIVY